MNTMYTDVERSIYEHLRLGLAARGLNYQLFNNLVSKEDFAEAAALCIMKLSDTFAPEAGGGAKAVIKEYDEASQTYSIQDWPDGYNLLYQFVVVAKDVVSARDMDQLLRDVLKPRKAMKLWDSEAEVWTDNYCDYQYAGYIVRDVPADGIYNRVTNIRFEAYNYASVVQQVPAIAQVTFTLEPVDGLPESSVVVPKAADGTAVLPIVEASGLRMVAPTGVKDGVNRVFTLPDAVNPDGLMLHWNGILIVRVSGNGDENWTLVGKTLTTVSFIPQADDDFIVAY